MKITFSVPMGAKVGDILAGYDEEGIPMNFRVTECHENGRPKAFVSLFYIAKPVDWPGKATS